MLIIRSFVLAACLLLTVGARAQDASQPLGDISDVVYKGLVGKAMDALPIEPEKRVILQRANAIISGPLTGRTLSVWIGITNPLLLIAGAVWGIYAALNINAAQSKVALKANSEECLGEPQIHDALLVIRPPFETDIKLTQ